MRTHESSLFGNVLAKSLTPPSPFTGQEIAEIERGVETEMESELSKAEGPGGVDPAKREAALRAWEKRERGHAEEMRRKAEAHRQAGEDDQAREAERSAARADIRHQRKLRALEEHRAGMGLAPKPGAKPAAKPAKPAPRIIDTAWRQGVRPPGEEDPGNKAERELAERQAREDEEARRQAKPEEKPKPKPKPVEQKHEGNWEQVKRKHRAERQRLHEEGFNRVDVHPLEEKPDGKHVAAEIFEHPDGRKVEHHVEYDSENDSGSLRTVHHAIPPAPPMLRPENNPQKAVVGHHEAMQAANKDHGQIEKVSFLGGGIRDSYKVKFKGGGAAVYKPEVTPVGVRRTLGNIPESRRELAAYKISNAAGFDNVPPIELVAYPDASGKVRKGHAMGWVDGEVVSNMDRNEFKRDAAASHPDLHRLAALDMIIGNTDRHAKNFMKGKDGRYYAIDNGLTMPLGSMADQWAQMHDNPSTPLHSVKGQAIPPEVKKEIARITPEHITSALKEAGFKEEDVKFALARLKVVQGLKTWKGEEELRQKMADVYHGRAA